MPDPPYMEANERIRVRAEAAEARVAELEAALRYIKELAEGKIHEDVLLLNSKLRDILVLSRDALGASNG